MLNPKIKYKPELYLLIFKRLSSKRIMWSFFRLKQMGATCGKVNKKTPSPTTAENTDPAVNQKSDPKRSPTEQEEEKEALPVGLEDRYFARNELYCLREKYKDSETLESVPKPSSTKDIRWREAELLGEGAFGKVILGLNLEKGELMAVKQVALDDSLEEKVQSLEIEIELLSQLKHKNIVRYIGTTRSKNKLNIFLEYIKGGSLIRIIKKFGNLNESLIRRYTAQILEGLEYLHYNKVIHRDIKGGNILVDNSGVCKLTDFGSSKKIYKFSDNEGNLHQSLRGTAHWMAPEVIKQTNYGRFADIWSVGCTIVEMVTGKPPFSNFTNPITAMFQIAKSNKPPPLPEGISPELKDFLTNCFKTVPHERYNVFKLLRHPFITGTALDTMSFATGGNLAQIVEEDDEKPGISPNNRGLTKIVIVSDKDPPKSDMELNLNMNQINNGYIVNEEVESRIEGSHKDFDSNKTDQNNDHIFKSLMSLEEETKDNRKKSLLEENNSSDQFKGSARNMSSRGVNDLDGYSNSLAIYEEVGRENEDENINRNSSVHKKKIDFNFEENLVFEKDETYQISAPKVMPNNKTFNDISKNKHK